MVITFQIFSDDVADFLREIAIDADATFLQLNDAILDACGYGHSQITCFYTCDENWEQQTQIALEDLGTASPDQDVYLMEDATLRDFVEDEEQRLVYIFDPFNDRVLYLTVKNIQPRASLDEPQCVRSQGQAPAEFIFESEPQPKTKTKAAGKASDLDFDTRNLFDEEGLNDDDIDIEGFEVEEY